MWRVVVGMGFLAGAVAQGATPVDVVLLGGQSNMVGGLTHKSQLPAALQQPQGDIPFYDYTNLVYGTPLTTLRPGTGANAHAFGPEITFGRAVADSQAMPLALIKCGRGATDLAVDWDPATGPAYLDFRNTVATGMQKLRDAGYEPRITGMLWTQGERDANRGRTTAQYTADLNEFITDVRGRYGADLPFFISRLSDNQLPSQAAAFNLIRAAQDAVAAADPHAFLIDTDGDAFSVFADDPIHFDSGGQIALGNAFAASYIANVPEPTALAWVASGSIAALARRRRAR